jgi:GT2 family glycosyltransferase
MTPTAAVTAIVLTFDAREAVERCVDAVLAQTRPLERVLVVDNASADPVTDLAQRHASVEVLRLPENLGPAGGHAAGLQWFLDATDSTASTGVDAWAWVMDDDCLPAPDALERQLAAAADADGSSVVLAEVTDAGGTNEVVGVGWWGALVPRAAIERAGLPIADLFWWVEDTEYLQWRLPRAGFPTRTARGAVVRVERARASRSKPAWKYYYEARNTVYYRFRIQRRDQVPAFASALTLRVRAWRAARSITKLAWRAALVERDGRVAKVCMVARGVLDGARGRLGRTVPVTEADRPSGPLRCHGGTT